jgi:uncharacterized protein YqhQ
MQVGGQAVIEGVMMRAPGKVATAVRRKNGTLEIRAEATSLLSDRFPVLKAPILRGAIGLVEMLAIGIRALNFSAEVALQDEREEGSAGGRVENKKTKREALALALTVIVALLIGLALFFATPLAVTTALFTVEQDPLIFNLTAGGIRLVILLLYLTAIALMRDVQRLFAYHGAEHKVVFAFERGAELTVEGAKSFSRFHPRCGTSFLLVVMLGSILLFAFLDALLLVTFGELTLLLRLLTHLPLIPLVGGVSYEFIRMSARHADSLVGRLIVAPGLWLQRITTREPDEAQLEVALAAIRNVVGDRGATSSTFDAAA